MLLVYMCSVCRVGVVLLVYIYCYSYSSVSTVSVLCYYCVVLLLVFLVLHSLCCVTSVHVLCCCWYSSFSTVCVVLLVYMCCVSVLCCCWYSSTVSEEDQAVGPPGGGVGHGGEVHGSVRVPVQRGGQRAGVPRQGEPHNARSSDHRLRTERSQRKDGSKRLHEPRTSTALVTRFTIAAFPPGVLFPL